MREKHKWKSYELEDIRDYKGEAFALIRNLTKGQKYELYEIVNKKMKYSNTETRDKELRAVKFAIESTPSLDPVLLKRTREGYRSEMAHSANHNDHTHNGQRRRKTV